jgi:predicted glycosyltransferase
MDFSDRKRIRGDGRSGTEDFPASPLYGGSEMGGSGYGGSGKGIRVLLYSHDTLGLGHLQRNLKISRALRARYPELAILLITGSPYVHRYSLPAEIDYIKLPAVRKVARERYESRYSDVPFERTIKLRSRIILEAVKEYSPHLLLVDHSPRGMKGEIVPSLEWLKKNKKDTVTALGMRDILDDPVNVIELWREQGTYDVLRDLYDRIFVYGAPLVFDPLLSYEFSADLRSKSRYVGYIADPGISDDSARSREHSAGVQRKFVLATFGGGDGWGHDQIESFLDVIIDNRSSIPFESMIITGPFMTDDHWKRFRNVARDLPVNIIRFVASTRPFLLRSDLVISSGGYNTITDVLSYARRALVIPRIKYRKEQYLRARRLSDLGVVDFMHPDDAASENLHDRIAGLLAGEEEPVAEARMRNLLPLDGGRRLSENVGGIFREMKVDKETSGWPKNR